MRPPELGAAEPRAEAWGPGAHTSPPQLAAELAPVRPSRGMLGELAAESLLRAWCWDAFATD